MPAWAAAPGWYSATKSRAEGPSYYFNELHTRHPTNLRHPERTPEGPGRLKAGGPNDEVAENPASGDFDIEVELSAAGLLPCSRPHVRNAVRGCVGGFAGRRAQQCRAREQVA